MGGTTFEFLPHTPRKKIPPKRVIRKKADSHRPIQIEVTPKVPDDLKDAQVGEGFATEQRATYLAGLTEEGRAEMREMYCFYLERDPVRHFTSAIQHTRPNGDFVLECVSRVISKEHVADYVDELQKVAKDIVHSRDA